MKFYKLFATTVLLGSTFASAASAQSVNYGTLEDIFGEPVTTSATGKPQRASEAPVAMEILTQEDIRRSGAKDIPQLLQHVAGVEVIRSFNGNADVNIRGYNQPYSNRLLVLVNGRQVLTDFFGTTYWSMLPIQMKEIRQVEVVKGPNSSLFGFNAESGVVNIITYNPLDDDIASATVALGTQEYQKASAVQTFKVSDKVAARVGLGVETADGFNRASFPATSEPGRDSSDALMSRNINFDIQAKLDEKSELRLEGSYGNGQSDVQTPFFFNLTQRQKIGNYQVAYKRASNYGLWDVSVMRTGQNWRSDIAAFAAETDTTVTKVQNLFKVGADHAFRIGTEYRHNSITGDFLGGGNNKFDYDLYATSAMWDWQLNDSTSWTNSVRYDYVKMGRDEAPTFGTFSGDSTSFNRDIEEISYNSALLHKLNDEDKVRFSVARGLHIPSLSELSGAALMFPGMGFSGDPTLQTERNFTVELGYTHEDTETDSKFSANLFWERVENVLGGTIVNAPVPFTFIFNNVGDSEATGIELSYERKYDNWLDWGVNYTGVSTKDEQAPSLFIQYEGTNPKHQLSLYGGFTKGKWEFNSDANYVSEVQYRAIGSGAGDNVINDVLEQYVVLNARVGYNVDDNTNVSLSGYNLIDKHREVGQGSLGPLGYGGGNSLGKSVILNYVRKF